MKYRYNGKVDRFDKKNGKLRRQVDADTRKGESTVRDCGKPHTNRGYLRATLTTHRHKH
jgi:hypothetical protein